MESVLEQLKGGKTLAELAPEQLGPLAGEIRELMKTTVSRNGGHLASNLGVVELTMALHRVFNFERDRLVFDVGHQCYVHKILTGRAGRFETLRQAGGLSGFPAPQESPCDQFAVGHAGTAVATAVGLALGAQMNQSREHIVALVGDGSIVNGLSFEGLNNTHHVKRQLLIILNDNSMAIDKTEGAFANYLARLRVSRSYEDLRRTTQLLTRRLPVVGPMLHDTLGRVKEGIKTTLMHRQIFEQLGIPYLGPVDGHDLPSLITLLRTIKDIDHPVLLHVQTDKGRGFDPAHKDPCAFHSPPPFKLDGDMTQIPSGQGTAFTDAFARALAEQMRRDSRVVALTAAMPDGTGLAQVRREFPRRVLDVGIAESGAVDIAAGLAKTGHKPVVAIYSTFLQRSFDQIFQEVSLQNLPVVFCLDRAGLVGSDGAVHHGFCDITLLRALPNLVLTAPMDADEMGRALAFALACGRPCVLRYPRDVASVQDDGPAEAFELGRARWLRQGKDAVILSYGAVGPAALEAARTLTRQGIETGVADMRFAKPIDEEAVRSALSESRQEMGCVVTVEDHTLAGGFGAAVLETAQRLQLDTRRLLMLGLPDDWVAHDSRKAQLAAVGLDAAGIGRRVLEFLEYVSQKPTEKRTQPFFPTSLGVRP